MEALGAPRATSCHNARGSGLRSDCKGAERDCLVCSGCSKEEQAINCVLTEGLVCTEPSTLPPDPFFASGSFRLQVAVGWSLWKHSKPDCLGTNPNLPPGPQHLAKCILCWLSHRYFFISNCNGHLAPHTCSPSCVPLGQVKEDATIYPAAQLRNLGIVSRPFLLLCPRYSFWRSHLLVSIFSIPVLIQTSSSHLDVPASQLVSPFQPWNSLIASPDYSPSG